MRPSQTYLLCAVVIRPVLREICLLEKDIETPSPQNGARVQTTELLNRRWLSKTAFEIELSRPASFEFEAGHTIRFIHKSLERYYSLLSAPRDPVLTLCVYLVSAGQFSPVLAGAEIGTRFKISGPHGYFLYTPSDHQAVFVASGTGVAPFVSMGRSGVSNFILLHEITSLEERYYQKIFQEAASHYLPCLLEAPPAESESEGTFQGTAVSYIKKNLKPAQYDFYLCGEREMIRAVTLIADERFAGSHVFTEVFY